jgi:hypothetical protein
VKDVKSHRAPQLGLDNCYDSKGTEVNACFFMRILFVIQLHVAAVYSACLNYRCVSRVLTIPCFTDLYKVISLFHAKIELGFFYDFISFLIFTSLWYVLLCVPKLQWKNFTPDCIENFVSPNSSRSSASRCQGTWLCDCVAFYAFLNCSRQTAF